MLLAGCNAALKIPASDSNSFLGAVALADGQTPQGSGAPLLRVLTIHGMGTTNTCGFTGFFAAFAKRLGLVEIPPAATEPLDEACPDGPQPVLAVPAPQLIAPASAPAPAKLYTYAFGPSATGPAALKISFLLWSPLTTGIKTERLKADGALPRQAFAQAAKDFIDDKFADVLLYTGSYRVSVMRPAVEAALCLVIGGTPGRDLRDCRHGDYREPTILLTHSQGGYMLMDAIDDELGNTPPTGVRAEQTAAAKIVAKTQGVFMLANQLALLDLTALTSYPPHATPSTHAVSLETAAQSRGEFGRLMRNFAQHWARLRGRLPPAVSLYRPSPPPPDQIVAFSDPNDILSWLVTKEDLGLPAADAPKVSLTNVYLSNHEFEIPALFSDPVTAHTGYFENQTVIDLLACGMDNGAVKRCPPAL
ncbi:MAG: hypothetical protein JO107_14250 [Hyphomicrobiales bacterium]|nr:hypothetical protein [Hyphomicrobiales bacterium]MBV8664251.1 hypothetical protein [Hyphomicrobiales bacterium]